MTAPLWQPSPEQVARSRLTAFTRAASDRWGVAFGGYPDLHRWSVEHPDQFWSSVWSFTGVIGEPGGAVVRDAHRMPGAEWFPQARLNFAENLLRRSDASQALLFRDESGSGRARTHAELRDEVFRLQRALRAWGVKPGDRVAGFLPNIPEAVSAMLATTSLGAIWSSCSPDFGVRGVLDRFGQIEPRVLFTADGYRYAGRRHDSLPKVREIAAALPSLEKVVVVPHLEAEPMHGAPAGAICFAEACSAPAGETRFERLPFAHPVYILYSSGTTGAPKCIVHGSGGTLLQHLKEHQLHVDLSPGERLFYFTTCGWMMWNWLVSGLASEATLVLYDGSPFHPDGEVLFRMAEREGVHVFGTSAKFIDAAAKAGLEPGRRHDLSKLRSLLSTGSPLAPEGFDFVYDRIKSDLQLASISGGTDIVSCFVLGNPNLPVWRGEIQCAGLGMAVDVYDDAGRPLRGGKGELVCTAPFPSMPLGFWNDADGQRLRSAYFERFPGVWCHGDFAEIGAHGGFVIHGRSDAVLNPGGVRIGTAEIYRQVEQIEEVVEAIAIGQEWKGDTRIVLFVRLREPHRLDDALRARIAERIRTHASPRHVPARIVEVADIPRTRSGKIVELAVRDVVHGRPVRNREALANPEALELFVGIADLAT